MAAPDPVSIGSISSTEAPSVMSASACCCIVDTLPCALSILKSLDDSPAASNAFVRFGASYWTYRVDVVVSGSSTPILPLPCAARLCRVFITAKSAVNLVTSTWGTAPPPDDDVLDELDELDPQLAAAAASARAAVTAAICFGRWCMQIPLLSGRGRPDPQVVVEGQSGSRDLQAYGICSPERKIAVTICCPKCPVRFRCFHRRAAGCR